MTFDEFIAAQEPFDFEESHGQMVAYAKSRRNPMAEQVTGKQVSPVEHAALFVRNCPRGEWLGWLAEKASVDARLLSSAKNACIQEIIPPGSLRIADIERLRNMDAATANALLTGIDRRTLDAFSCGERYASGGADAAEMDDCRSAALQAYTESEQMEANLQQEIFATLRNPSTGTMSELGKLSAVLSVYRTLSILGVYATRPDDSLAMLIHELCDHETAKASLLRQSVAPGLPGKLFPHEQHHFLSQRCAALVRHILGGEIIGNVCKILT